MSYERWRMAVDALAREGYVVMSGKGTLQQSPWVGIANTSLDHMRRFMIEFGMTPSSRARVKTEPVQQEDPFEQFMARKARAK